MTGVRSTLKRRLWSRMMSSLCSIHLRYILNDSSINIWFVRNRCREITRTARSTSGSTLPSCPPLVTWHCSDTSLTTRTSRKPGSTSPMALAVLYMPRSSTIKHSHTFVLLIDAGSSKLIWVPGASGEIGRAQRHGTITGVSWERMRSFFWSKSSRIEISDRFERVELLWEITSRSFMRIAEESAEKGKVVAGSAPRWLTKVIFIDGLQLRLATLIVD